MLYTKQNTKQTFIKPLQAASAFWSGGFLQIVCSSSCWGTHHRPFDAQLDITFTPAFGVSTSQVLGLCMAFWKPDSDYLLLLTISVFNAEYIVCEIEILSEEMQRKNHEMSPQLYLYHFIILEENSRQNCFASMLPSLLAYVGIKSWRKQTCLAHGEDYSLPSGHSLPWQPPKHHAFRSFLNPFTTARRKNQMHWMHWTRTYRMYMDVHGPWMYNVF